jgi:hypothetical protein
MQKNILIIMSLAISLQSCGQSQTRIEDKDFAIFANKFAELKLKKFPAICKQEPNKLYFRGNPSHKISLEEAKKYLGYSEKDFFVTEFDYNMDDDIKSNIRQVENAPFADNKISQNNYIALMYFHSSSRYLDECDTIVEVLNTFTLNGNSIDKIVIQGQYTREDDWRDVVFLENNILRIFDYKPNAENFNEKGEIINEKEHLTIVEIADYQIADDGKIIFVQSYPKQYLNEWITFYRYYQPNSDDPINAYDF